MNSEQDLLQRIAELEAKLAQAEARNLYLEEQFRLAQQKQFGQSAEGFDVQGDLFDEAEEATEVTEAETQDIRYTRKKPKRQALPKDLLREQVIHDIADEDKQCECCGGELHKMGEDISEKLDFVPAKVKVIEHIRPKYACRECEKTGTNNHIKQAKMPTMPINKGIATSSLLSQIITSKYQYALPLHRQETMFKQYGIELSRKTMSDWVLKSAVLFEPLIQRLKQELLKQPVVHVDETTVNVVNADKVKSYMWLYCTGTYSPTSNSDIPNIVLYDYQNSRAASCVVNYLDGYSGYLQVDGYAAYEKTQATLACCWSHARRKFIEAKEVQGKKRTGKADVVLSLIQKLYGIESKAKDKTPVEKHEIRTQQSRPVIDKLRLWLEKNQPRLIGKTKLAEAANYLANQWPKLIVYLEDGKLNIGRVGMWRSGQSTLFPHPAHQTGRALLTHPAFV